VVSERTHLYPDMVDDFWDRARTNLRAGRVRVVVSPVTGSSPPDFTTTPSSSLTQIRENWSPSRISASTWGIAGDDEGFWAAETRKGILNRFDMSAEQP
jgi:hypothetical protein